MNPLSTLYRTTRANYSRYAEDGYGRDRYIAYNNGGFLKGKTCSPDDGKTTGTNFQTKIEYRYKSPSIKCPNFKYHSDGNGRDSYIMVNGGGLFYDSKPLCSYRLTDFLRAPQARIFAGKAYLSKSEAKYNQLLRNNERDIVRRLYEKEKNKFIKKSPFNSLRLSESNSIEQVNEDEKMQALNTMPSIFPKIEEKHLLTDSKNKTKKLLFSQMFDKNLLKNNRIYEDMQKINKYDAKKMRKDNKTFVQPYFHLRNLNC